MDVLQIYLFTLHETFVVDNHLAIGTQRVGSVYRSLHQNDKHQQEGDSQQCLINQECPNGNY